MMIKPIGKENPIIQLFGNSLIASVFQALILKTIEDIFNLKLNEDIPINSK